MKSISLCIALVAGAAVSMSNTASAAIIGAGNLVVFQAGDGGTLGNNTTFSVLELTKLPGQASPVQTFDISGSASNPMWTSASATSTGYLSLSENRGSVQFNTHTDRGTSPFPNINTRTARAVGSISAAGSYSQLGAYTGGSGNQARSGALMNGGTLFIGDQGGIYATGNAAPSVTNNVRNLRSFGGVAYAFQASATLSAVSAISGTPSVPVLTGVPGLGALGTNVQDFYMLSTTNDSNFDLLYVSTTTGVNKYQLVSGNWTARGTATITGGFFGLAAELDAAGGVDLYLTTGTGATNGNSVKRFIDSSSTGGNITLDGGTTLFTAPTGFTIKGIELAPVPAPGAAALLGLGGLIAARRRRN